MKKLFFRLCASFITIVSLASCQLGDKNNSSSSNNNNNTASVGIKLKDNSARKLQLADTSLFSFIGTFDEIESVKVTVKNNNISFIIDQELTFDASDNAWSGTLTDLPYYEPLTFIGRAYNGTDPSADMIFIGQTDQILTRKSLSVYLNMNPIDDGKGFNLPRITKIQKLSSMEPSTSQKIIVSIGGNTGENISYEVSPISLNSGSFSPSTGTITLSDTTADIGIVYTAPAEEGDFIHSFKVTNSQRNAVSTRFKLAVEYSTCDAELIAQTSPVITSLEAERSNSSIQWTPQIDDNDSSLAYLWDFSGTSVYFNSFTSASTIMSNYTTFSEGTLILAVTDSLDGNTTIEYALDAGQFPDVNVPLKTSSVSVSGTHSCANLANGAAKCWGSNIYGETGTGSSASPGSSFDTMGLNLADVDLGWEITVKAISTGLHFSCAILNNNAVKCWGRNQVGQLGLGNTVDRGRQSNLMGDQLPEVDLGTGQTAIDIEAGLYHACAILDNGSVKCWGYNYYGQLGQDNTTNLGDNANEMGDLLPAIYLGTERSAVAISAGGYHTCAILDNGTVKCWGYNNAGQLGLGNTVNRGSASGHMNSLPIVNLGTDRTAIAIAAGEYHTCALLDNNTVKCWGFASNGQLGLGNRINKGDNSDEMGDALPTVDLGAGLTAISISANNHQTCAILNDRSLKCWGLNNLGQLGLEDSANRGDNSGEMGDALPAINLGSGRTALSVSAGSSNTCAVLDNDTVKCWGYNNHGQLGLEDTNTRGNQTGQMGDYLPIVDLGFE